MFGIWETCSSSSNNSKSNTKKINSFVCVSKAMDDEGNEMVSVFKSIVLRVRHPTVCACEESIYSTESRKELNWISCIDLIEMIGRVYDGKNDRTLEYTLTLYLSNMVVNVVHCTIYPYQDASDRWYFRQNFCVVHFLCVYVHVCICCVQHFEKKIVHLVVFNVYCLIYSLKREKSAKFCIFFPVEIQFSFSFLI